MLGSGIGGLSTLETQHSLLMAKGPHRVSPFMIPMMISNMASGLVSMEFGLQGPNICNVSACATANNAIGEAWRIIKFGDADAFLAGGSEASVIPLGCLGFRRDEGAQQPQRRTASAPAGRSTRTATVSS